MAFILDPVAIRGFDSFGRARVSQPETVFDSKQLGDKLPLVWDDATISGTASSTYSLNRASTTLAVSAGVAGRRARQTFRRFNYQPGKSQFILCTGVLAPEGFVRGVKRRIGYTDMINGMYFEAGFSEVSVVSLSNVSGAPVPTSFLQKDWNIDKMDGKGRSGIKLDWTKSQIFVFEFEWLGVGTQMFGVVVDRTIHYVHAINNANKIVGVYCSTPNLPIRYEIEADGTQVGPASIEHICSTVISEGGRATLGTPRSVARTTLLATNNDANIYPLVAIELKSAYAGVNVVPTNISVACTTTSPYRWVLLRDPTVTGTAFSLNDLANSAVRFDIARTNATTVSGGTELASGFGANDVSGSLQPLLDAYMGFSIAGLSTRLVLGVTRLSGTAESFVGCINFNEIV